MALIVIFFPNVEDSESLEMDLDVVLEKILGVDQNEEGLPHLTEYVFWVSKSLKENKFNENDYLVPKEEVDFGKKACPVLRYKEQLLKNKILTDQKVYEISEKIEIEINQAFEKAKAARLPNLFDAMNHQYA